MSLGAKRSILIIYEIATAAFGSLAMTILTCETAWAYIDPGTGMAFVSGVGAWLIGLLTIFFGAISLTYKKWIGFLKKCFSFLKK